MFYFIGIKGSGMSALACLLHDLGNEISGSDTTNYLFTQQSLEERAIRLLPFDKNNIKSLNKKTTVIVGHSFNEENNEEVKELFSNSNIEYYWYNDYLGRLVNQYESICIAGTHGKTTTTGLVYHLMKDYIETAVLIGDSTGHGDSDSKMFVLESCEFKDHFLAYHPKYAIINNIDLDHIDYFKTLDNYIHSFEIFASQVSDRIIANGDDENIMKMKCDKPMLKFGFKDYNDVIISNLVEDKEGISFDLYINKELFGHFDLPFYGMHMVYNSVATICIGYLLNMSAIYIQDHLASFPGVKRRFQIEEVLDNIYVDDYAHHPTAIKLTLETARKRYPDKNLIAVYKPDRYSRIHEFETDFATALEVADYAYVLNFPETAIKDLPFEVFASDITRHMSNAEVIDDNYEYAKKMTKHHNSVFVFMSTKDVYKLKNKIIEVVTK